MDNKNWTKKDIETLRIDINYLKERLLTINHELGGIEGNLSWLKWLVCFNLVSVIGFGIKLFVGV